MSVTWKDVVGFEGLYEVSSDGQIRRASACYNAPKGKILSFDESRGYLRAALYKAGKKQRIFAHRVVAEAFFGKEADRPFVNHKNGIKTDNRVENLEWVTRSENSRHALATGLVNVLIGESHPMAKLKEADVLEIRRICGTGIPQHKIAKLFGVSQSRISHILTRKDWKHIST